MPLSRRSFLYTAGWGAITVAAGRPLANEPGKSPVPTSPSISTPDRPFDEILPHLVTSAERGVPYLQDSLTSAAVAPALLDIRTELADPSRYGRRSAGWVVDAVPGNASTSVTLRERATLGNRSQLSRFTFQSTQRGMPSGEHGMVEMRLCRGTTWENVPVRIRIENGAFSIFSLNKDTLLAGDPEKRIFLWEPDALYTLSVLLFQKAIYARLTSLALPQGPIDLVVSDRRRFIPGLPGFGLRPNSKAKGSLLIRDWEVHPVGPADQCYLGVIGDSITAGSDLEPEAESYAHLVTRGLGQPYVLNVGSGGSTTRLDAARFPYEIAPFQPKIVWLEGGTNDLAGEVSADTIFANLLHQRDLVTWGGRVALSTVPPRILPTSRMQEELEILNRRIRESGLPYVDRNRVVGDTLDPTQIRSEFRHADGIHITRPGHAAIAEAALALFRPWR
ncbi:MAG TPA: GDSL-type esterase/lipase family protein [Opitutaceae bacterium]|nr:GDSL-type esterase/lipase family protein [Opitutaceae bacterium]